MDIEFIKNPKMGILEAWEDGRVVGEFVATGMLAKGWKLSDCIVRKGQRLCSDERSTRNMMAHDRQCLAVLCRP